MRSLVASGQVMSPGRVANIVGQVARALDAAHAQRLIHRDVKPANMLLDPPGKRPDSGSGLSAESIDYVYLSDFGISRQMVASRLTSTGQFVGTLDYIAPEQIESQMIDGRADQYSLACAAYEMITGAPPFGGDQSLALIGAHLTAPPPSATARRPDIPAATDLVLARAMSKAPAARYSTCAEFATDLGRALGVIPGQPIAADGAVQPSGQPTAGPATELANPAPNADQPTWAPPPQPVRPGYQPWPQPTPPPQVFAEPPPPRRRSGAVIAAVVGVVAIAIVAAAATVFVVIEKNPAPTANPAPSRSSSTPSPSPSPSRSPSTSTASTEAAQAKAMNMVLTASTASRISLEVPVNNVSTCSNLGAAVSGFEQVASQRSQQLVSAENLSVTALPDGSTLKSDLLRALRVYRSSDEDYMRWAEHQQATGCADGDSPPGVVTTSNQTSNAARATFNGNWDPIAERYNYPTDPFF